MCYMQDVCPLYRPDGPTDQCLNCVYLQNAKRSITKARIALAIAILAFIITTYIIW